MNTNNSDLPKRPGVTAATLLAAGVKFSDYPEPGSVEIPYFDLKGAPVTYRDRNGKLRPFARYRLPMERSDGQKYHQEPGTGVHAYFPVIGKAAANEQELGPDSIMLVEGEFKCLSLVEAGIPAIGLPSFNVYTNDENGEPRLLDDLRRALDRGIQPVYFLGDADTSTNFEFSRQAVFLARAIAPKRVLLPRIPISGPKGIDDCRNGLNGNFDPFLRKLIQDAVPISSKLSVSGLALMLLEREAKALEELTGEHRELQFQRIVKLCASAQIAEPQASSTARLREFGASILKLGKREMQKAVVEQINATCDSKATEAQLAALLEARLPPFVTSGKDWFTVIP